MTSTLPVEVLMKSAPASIARKEAAAILSEVTRRPVSRMTLRMTGRPRAAEVSSMHLRIWAISEEALSNSPARKLLSARTMSISSAPASMALFTSSIFTSVKLWEVGKQPATVVMWTSG